MKIAAKCLAFAASRANAIVSLLALHTPVFFRAHDPKECKEMRIRKKWAILAAGVGVLAISTYIYAKTHPLVFNESMWEHAHCMKIATLTLLNYAAHHNGQFPTHLGGYGDALLLLDEETYFSLTGAGFDPVAFHDAKKKGEHLPDEKCGRVYIQGLTSRMNPDIVLLFDKIPTPGGDHCPFPYRHWAPLRREVRYIGGHMGVIEETEKLLGRSFLWTRPNCWFKMEFQKTKPGGFTVWRWQGQVLVWSLFYTSHHLLCVKKSLIPSIRTGLSNGAESFPGKVAV